MRNTWLFILMALFMATSAASAQTEERDRTWGRAYFYGFYDDRWDNINVFAKGHYGYYLTDGDELSVFGMGQVSKDTRVEGGLYPALFNDNYILGAAGFRYRPWRPFYVDAQLGYAYDFEQRSGKERGNIDFRVQGIYGDGIYAENYFLDAFGSLGYYSRYENTIAYGLARAGYVVLPFMDVYVLGRGALDWNVDYYNNLVEAGVGLRFITSRVDGLVFGVEYNKGWYIDRPNVTFNPYGAKYDALRIYVTYELNF